MRRLSSIFLFQAWDVILKETEVLMKNIRTRCDHLSSHTLDTLNQFITEKKAARKKYLEERTKLDADFMKVIIFLVTLIVFKISKV